jgi:BASS family bile acid:Na+ symporter
MRLLATGSRALEAAPGRLTWIALLALALAVIVPSAGLAADSDTLLGLLVLATALGISVTELAGLRDHWREVAVLSVAPLVVLAGASWVLSQAFTGGVRDGLLATGLASSEVASVGLVALAGADATIALGVVTGSLVASALLGPVVIGWLGGAGAHANGLALLGRFALVVIAPLAVGVALRTLPAVGTRVAAKDPQREGVCALVVALLVYAALSGASGGSHLASAALASAAFLAVSAALAAGWHAWARRRRGATALPGAFTIAMRDFAVAAALATQAYGTRAGTVPGVYGVLMLVGGSAVAARMRSR